MENMLIEKTQKNEWIDSGMSVQYGSTSHVLRAASLRYVGQPASLGLVARSVQPSPATQASLRYKRRRGKPRIRKFCCPKHFGEHNLYCRRS